METNKKNKVSTIFIVLAIGLAVGCGSTFLVLTRVLGYNDEVISQENKTESVSVDKVEKYNPVREEALAIDGLFVNDLINRYGRSDDAELMSIYYNGKTIVPSELDSNFVKKLIAKDANNALVDVHFTNDDYFKSQTKLFGDAITYATSAEIDLGCDNKIRRSGDTYYYSPNLNSACGGMISTKLLRKVMSAKKTVDGIDIVVAAGIVTLDKKVYRDYGMKDQIGVTVIDGTSTTSFSATLSDEDFDKLNKFKYVFKYDEKNNNYYLEKIEPTN